MEKGSKKYVGCLEKLENLKWENQFSMSIPLKIDILSPYYPYYRRIRGDGNCYYRAVMFQYIERIIAEGKDKIQTLIDLVNSDTSFFEFTDTSIASILTTNLSKIKQIREKKGAILALKYNYDLMQSNNEYDLACIKMLRSVVANFLELNSDLEIYGISFEQVEDPIESFIENIVLKNKELARTIVLQAAPLALRIGIMIVVLTDDKEENNPEELFTAIHPELHTQNEDGLDWHNEFISTIYHSGHYNSLYHKTAIEKYPEIACYNDANLKCTICDSFSLDNLMISLHDHIAHYSCFMTFFKQQEYKKCPICDTALGLEDIKIFATQEDYKTIEKYLHPSEELENMIQLPEEKIIPGKPVEKCKFNKDTKKSISNEIKNNQEDIKLNPTSERKMQKCPMNTFDESNQLGIKKLNQDSETEEDIAAFDQKKLVKELSPIKDSKTIDPYGTFPSFPLLPEKELSDVNQQGKCCCGKKWCLIF